MLAAASQPVSAGAWRVPLPTPARSIQRIRDERPGYGDSVLDYFRLDVADARTRLGELVEAGRALRIHPPGQRTGRPGHVADALAAEPRVMRGWLGLDRVEAVDRGDLAPHLRRSLA